ncbi:MAG: hypothetical protein HYZ13_10755 [Acidobacteria bacterium]|nr:hypothetical protein [Acidobacteriota bacterium]
MNRVLTRLSLVCLAAGSLAAQEKVFTPTIKFSGLLQAWYTQMLDSNLRLNSTGSTYSNVSSNFKENTFAIRRAEIKLSGDILPNVSWEAMIDPSISTSASNPSILQDMAIVYKPAAGLEVKVGQFKGYQTLEGMTSSADLMFAERSMMGVRFGDKRDRGIIGTYSFGDPKGFRSKLSAGFFNGNTQFSAGKSNDLNAMKDLVLRLEFFQGSAHNFGLYTLQGSTDLKDSSAVSLSFGASGATAAAVKENKDKTSDLGAFYAYRNHGWRLEAEYITGLVGRLFPSLGTAAGTAKRQHLDQKFTSTVLSASYTTGKHTFGGRYDLMNWNSGDDWYGTTNPYKTVSGDFTPKFTEITAGYAYAFNPAKYKAANIRLNYINRSKNFLSPRPGQTGEQGGDTLVLSFQIAY